MVNIQKYVNNYNDNTPDRNTLQYKIKFIPSSTTKYIKTIIRRFLDNGKNYLKKLSRKITDKITLHKINLSIYQRDNIIKMQSLIHNQLSSPRYKNLFSWYKSGP